MFKHIMLFVMLALKLLNPSILLADKLIGGEVVDPADYTEIMLFRTNSGACTATLVGPRAVLVADHCLGNGNSVMDGPSRVSLTCEGHPSTDIALCKSENLFKRKMANISLRAAKIGQPITLMGFGCITEGGEDRPDGRLRHGDNEVGRLGSRSPHFYTFNKPALCFGDSGGPVFKGHIGNHGEIRVIQGINSRGDIQNFSLFEDLGRDLNRKWIKDYANDNEVKICGVNYKCGEKPKPKDCGNLLQKFLKYYKEWRQCRRNGG